MQGVYLVNEWSLRKKQSVVILKDSSVESFNTSVMEWVDDEKVRNRAPKVRSSRLALFCASHL